MGEDLRRRFIYGLTIENTTARLWYSDRSQVVVSSPFDFVAVSFAPIRCFSAY